MKFISPRRTYMSDSIEALQSALATVNTLGEQLTQGVGSLQNHNTDPEAHDDIRQTLKDLMDSDNVYTKDQINTVVDNKIKEHTDGDITTVHNGAALYQQKFATEAAINAASTEEELNAIQIQFTMRDFS